MKSLYVVSALESAIMVVEAKSKEEALYVFTHTRINDENLVYFLDSFSVNDGLYETFYRDEEGHLYDFTTDRPVERLLELDEQDQEKYIMSCVEENVKVYWKDEPRFATEYLEEVAKRATIDGIYEPSFSDELKQNVLKKLIQGDNWYEHFSIVEIDLKGNNHQEIYRYN